MADDVTSIQVSRETWKDLNARKEGPDDTFDDVIQRLIDEADGD